MENTQKLAAGLRDFFMARNGAELESALLALGWNGPRDAAALQNAEYAFNHLFIGPDAPAAPPYSSIYLDVEPLLMGQSCMEVRAFMADLGLASLRLGSAPEDHLACELELWLFLQQAMRELDARENQAEVRGELSAALDWLTNEHMAMWLPLFISRAAGAAEGLECLSFALTRLEYWLNQCSQRRIHEQ